jgi:hypothetical protein
MKRSRYVLLIVIVSLAMATVLTLHHQPGDGIWRFNFAPDSAPDRQPAGESRCDDAVAP